MLYVLVKHEDRWDRGDSVFAYVSVWDAPEAPTLLQLMHTGISGKVRYEVKSVSEIDRQLYQVQSSQDFIANVRQLLGRNDFGKTDLDNLLMSL